MSALVQVMSAAERQQAITWAIVDAVLCHHMASQGHNMCLPNPVWNKISEQSRIIMHRSVHWTHRGRVTQTCISLTKLTIVGSDNGLPPGRRQAIIRTNAGILLIGTLGTNFSEMFIEVHIFHSRKCIWKCHLRNVGHFAPSSMS